MTSEIDIDAYLSRIHYDGVRSPTLEVLSSLQSLHTQHIPFEGLNPLLRLPVPLDLKSLQDKLVRGGRGGYCFEHNILFSTVLRELGFDVTWHSARVVWMVPEGVTMPRTHMTTLVRLGDDRYMVDVGYGGMTVTSPIKLVTDVAQQTTHEPFRLVNDTGHYLLQTQFAGRWNSLYRFDLQEQLLADYELTNWYMSNSPDSRFVAGLVAARVSPGKRYALLNNKFAVHSLYGETVKRVITDVGEFRKVLADDFQINLTGLTNLDHALQELINRQ
jgi:N-hydroxyarylamine O-acetyltransferase